MNRPIHDDSHVVARAHGAFVAAMSRYEVRAPLDAILALADLLSETALDLDQRKHLEILRRGGRSLQSLFDNALELSRLDQGAIERISEPFEVDDLVHECAAAFAVAARRKGVALVTSVAATAKGTAVGDDRRVRQVLFHLLDNAVKFTQRGRIALRARTTDDPASLIFEVEDTGLGIALEDHAVVFERFAQVESGTARRFDGCGLGLAVARELLLAIGGRISVVSAPGAGSVFRATLPLPVKLRAGP
jgi:signal transduction histidine kinase